MLPWQTLDTASTPDGSLLTLVRRDDEFVIRAGAGVLMSSRQHGSEDALAHVACRLVSGRSNPTLLIGGLGMGFTLRAALDALPPDARVTVAELVPAIVEWNRGPLASLAHAPLDDSRVELVVSDVRRMMGKQANAFDVILLDVDNGPQALTTPANAALYFDQGLRAAKRALKPGGALVVWSAAEDPVFVRRLEKSGFRVAVERPTVRGIKQGARHVLFVARTDEA